METLPIFGITEFTASETLSSFYSNVLSHHLKSHHFINKPHKHSTYIAVLFTHGTGEHQIDFDSFPVCPGAVFMLNPGQVHSWTLSEDTEGFVFFHSREFYDNNFLTRKIDHFPFFYLQKNHPVVYLSEKSLSNITDLFKEINLEFSGSDAYKTAKIGSLVDLVYIEISRLYNEKSDFKDTGANYIRVKKLQKLIDVHFKTLKNASDYADMMNMSIRHLSRICKETINKSTSDLIIERIITEAKRMLINSDVTVSMVVDELGYKDQSYFARLFKKQTGLGPKEFQGKAKI